jgi:hypothetical protein
MDLQLEAEYEKSYGRFLRDQEVKLQGQFKSLKNLKQEFRTWQKRGSGSGERVPFLCDLFMKVCRDLGAVLYKSSAVRFLAEGESTIDAAMCFKWRVKGPLDSVISQYGISTSVF